MAILFCGSVTIVDIKNVHLCSKNQRNELLTPTTTMNDHSEVGFLSGFSKVGFVENYGLHSGKFEIYKLLFIISFRSFNFQFKKCQIFLGIILLRICAYSF